jgi:hypothetical protein
MARRSVSKRSEKEREYLQKEHCLYCGKMFDELPVTLKGERCCFGCADATPDVSGVY